MIFSADSLLTRALSALAFFFACAAALRADTLVLTDGTEIQNVRTWVTKGQVHAIDRTGKTQSFPEQNVKSIKPAVVNWEPQPGTEDKKVEPGFWMSPAGLALQGAAPGWSGLYRSDRPWLGVPFTVLEIGLLANTIRWGRPPKSLQEDLRPALFAYGFVAPAPPGVPPLPPGTYNTQFFLDWTMRLTLLDQVKSPGGGYISKSSWQHQKNTYTYALGLTLALDAVLSVMLGGPSSKSSMTERPSGPQYSFQFVPADHGRSTFGFQAQFPF